MRMLEIGIEYNHRKNNNPAIKHHWQSRRLLLFHSAQQLEDRHSEERRLRLFGSIETSPIEYEIVRHRGIEEIYMKSSLGYFLWEYFSANDNEVGFAIYWWYLCLLHVKLNPNRLRRNPLSSRRRRSPLPVVRAATPSGGCLAPRRLPRCRG